MALEAVVFPQDPFNYSYMSGLGYGLEAEQERGFVGMTGNVNWDYSSVLQDVKESWDSSNSSPQESVSPAASTGRRKRRRTKTTKNQEEIESQRMTHIAVERNRRKQMNEYLTVLRSLMPSSYVQRGDQASIIGGAINFVKELEQHLQSMQGQAKTGTRAEHSPFAGFFSFPQYTTPATQGSTGCTAANDVVMGQNQEVGAADIEVSLVDSHANLKILSRKRPGQLVKMVVGLQSLRLCILHLNVTTTLDDMVLYSVSVKVEDESQLNTVDEIAAAVNQLMRRIQEEAAFC
ncbi:transcription factor bHLH96-like [Neltuma alba]|uniref:transcription factor bHLH96-like n=1 Tax=Neltuma alba TaxID=207710 RepID=UPI0010A5205C|nr:transcription factor bHLH96-like [Prosopis alba]XP_028797104.1 transcription factor bHLH96-like [Prosopis alba]